ncbi:MAG: hypothetical protein J1F64_06715 [Oscillospiraceae bacterium]|nr:hypothetical protein [Oscillospiraceae bacterium]
MDNNQKNQNEIQNKKDQGGINKKAVAAVAAALAIVIIVWAAVSLSGKTNDSSKSNQNTDGAQTSDVQNGNSEDDVNPDAKPVFKFFYSASAENAGEVLAAVEELRAEYGDRVDFDINDIDEHPEYVEQFSVIAPPQLYMLKRNGDFADMKFGTADKNELEDAVKKALE